jgi:hypothetical protein
MSGFALKVPPAGGGNKEFCPAGNHPAVLVAMIDMGHQHHEYMGTASWRHDVYLVWQTPTKKNSKGEPHLLAAQVTMSLNEKATLRKWIEGMTGAKLTDGYDLSALLGRACLLNVIHNEKGYPRVKDVTGYPEGLPEPKPTLAPFACSLDEFRAGKEIPAWVPWSWLRSVEPPSMRPISEHVALCKELAGDGSGAGTFRSPLSAPNAAQHSGKGDPIPF